MSASAADVTAAIVAALAVDHGAGVDDGLDLSVGGRVVRGVYTEPPRVPFAAVSGIAASGSRREASSLSRWAWATQVTIAAWIPARSLSLHDRVERCEAVLTEFTDALTTAAATPGNALYAMPGVEIQSVAIDTDVEQLPGAVCQVQLVVSWTSSRLGGL